MTEAMTYLCIMPAVKSVLKVPADMPEMTRCMIRAATQECIR